MPSGPYEIDDLGHDVLALLDALEIERASYCGLSIGGMVGMWLGTHAPERIERLVLVCTSAHLPPAEGWAERAAAVRAAGTVEVVADAVVERWLTPGFAAEHPGAAGRAARDAGRHRSERLRGEACGAIERMDLRAELGRIEAPTLVISGAGDAATPPEHQRADRGLDRGRAARDRRARRPPRRGRAAGARQRVDRGPPGLTPPHRRGEDRRMRILLAAVTLPALAVAAPALADGPGVGTPSVVTLGDSAISGEAGRWAGNTNQSSSRVDALGSTAYYDTPERRGDPRLPPLEVGRGPHRRRREERQPRLLGREDDHRRHRPGQDFKPGIDFYNDAHGRQGQALALQEYATHATTSRPSSC